MQCRNLPPSWRTRSFGLCTAGSQLCIPHREHHLPSLASLLPAQTDTSACRLPARLPKGGVFVFSTSCSCPQPQDILTCWPFCISDIQVAFAYAVQKPQNGCLINIRISAIFLQGHQLFLYFHILARLCRNFGAKVIKNRFSFPWHKRNRRQIVSFCSLDIIPCCLVLSLIKFWTFNSQS